MLKKAIKKTLQKCGIDIRRVKMGQQDRGSMLGVLSNLKKLGANPKTVIDVGAAHGGWSSQCFSVFPNAEYILVEPLSEYEQILKNLSQKIKKSRYFQYAISKKSGSAMMYVHKDLVGSSTKEEVEEYNQKNSESRIVTSVSLDELCARENIQCPHIIKIDIQGAELEALVGAQNILKNTLAAILEVSLFKGFKGGHQLDEVIVFMKKLGFVAYDIFGFNYRPYDNALCQVDIVFVPENGKLRDFHSYATKEQRDLQDKYFIDKVRHAK